MKKMNELITFLHNIYHKPILKKDLYTVYFPDLKLAIEYNDLHYFDNVNHLSKFEQYKSNNIRLIQITEWEWKNKNDLIKSFLYMIIKNQNTKIFARKCKLSEISNSEYKSFTEKENLFRKRDKEPLLIIMETEKTFTSVLDCAEYLNCSPTTVSRNLNKILDWCVGYHLSYFKEYSKENNPYLGLPRFNNKPILKKDTFSVIIMETEEPFRTIQECADFIGVNRSGVNKVLSGKSKNTGGYHICYFKDYNRENNPWFGKDRFSEKKQKKLKEKYFVEELNKSFKSYQEIADYLKVDRITIYNLIKGKKTRLNLTIKKI